MLKFGYEIKIKNDKTFYNFFVYDSKKPKEKIYLNVAFRYQYSKLLKMLDSD